YEASIKGTDSGNDLAVIAIPLSSISADTMAQIKVASIGDSDALKVGEQVVAIGNALGYGQSVTTGIVSAKNRSIAGDNSVVNTSTDDEEALTYIQTDAAINPGNSGGALVNMNGEVVGINSAKMSSTEVEGMGYAIPVSRVSDIIETLMNETTRTKVEEGQESGLGITGLTVDAAVSQAYGIPAGIYVADVTAGSAAETAGIVKGYVITEFDGKSVTGIEELQELLQYYAAGETVEITVKVPDTGEYGERTLSLTLEQARTPEAEETEISMPSGFGIHW
ncbi:MAG: trypsin-like peptidase domain-containing protein, partial [Lachnospiraceae bacterium]|nr:trypsin-like peptidase domain-containing protein [Lachnospiraceae bacterium]